MECLYDTLFECDCEGIYELANLKCAGVRSTMPMTLTVQGTIERPIPALWPKLAKRINWISRCASLSMGWIHYFDNWKTNRWYIFLEVTHIWRTDPFTGKRLVPPWTKKKPQCYFLGSWPLLWDPQNKCPLGPWRLEPRFWIEFRMTPIVWGRDMFLAEGQPREILEQIWTKDEVENYFNQLAYIEYRKDRLNK